MKLSHWHAVEVDDFPSGTVVAAPLMGPVAEMVTAEAHIRGADRGVFLHVVLGAGLAIMRAKGPATPEPTFPVAPPPADEKAQA